MIFRSLVLMVLSVSFAIAQQEPGKDYVSTKLGPGTWHIEDTVQQTARDSMYLVEGNEKAALIDTGMGSGDLAG